MKQHYLSTKREFLFYSHLKTFSLLLLFFVASLGYGQTIIPTANTNSGSVNDPFAGWYGYERSAMIYTNAEIANSGNITSVGFYVNSVNSPSGEQVANVIDGDINTKYLDFFDFDGIAFTVNLNGVQKSATSMEFTTADDAPERDPMNYQILGSNDGTSFTSITTGSIACNSTRFNTTTYNFTNSAEYSYYRLIFTSQCDTVETIFQIAEVQLFHTNLGTDKFSETDNFALYPNPNNGVFSIRSKANNAIDFITISDALGKQIKQVQVNGATTSDLNLQGIASGIYFVQITSGSESVTKKIVIQ